MSEQQPQPSQSTPPVISEEELNKALKAYKKRIKLTILDQESKISGARPTTGGKKADIQGIIPPNQFSREVWKELARRKQIKDMGGGFYSLP